MIMLNGKDSFWLQLEVCREFQRSRCTRSDGECKFAHPPTNVEVQSNGRVTACYDSIKGRCQRESCKYMHPPAHLKDQLLINGRNHLALKNALLHQHHQQHPFSPDPQLTLGQHLLVAGHAHLQSHHHHHQSHSNPTVGDSHHPHSHAHQHQHQQHQYQQQQAALFQSALAALQSSSASQTNNHHQNHNHNNQSNSHNNHHHHHHQQQQPQQQHQQQQHHLHQSQQANISQSQNHTNNSSNQNHLSMPHPAAALAAAFAASSMNPFMTPGAFTHTYASQYAAAVAAAAATAAAAHQQSPRALNPTTCPTPTATTTSTTPTLAAIQDNNIKRIAGWPPNNQLSSALASTIKPSSKMSIKAPPSHYHPTAPPAVQAAAAVAAAAAAAAAVSSSASAHTPADQIAAAYYIAPAAILGGQSAAASSVTPNPFAGLYPNSLADQQQYQSVLSALYAGAGAPPPTAFVPPLNPHLARLNAGEPIISEQKLPPIRQESVNTVGQQATISSTPSENIVEQKSSCDRRKVAPEVARNDTTNGVDRSAPEIVAVASDESDKISANHNDDDRNIIEANKTNNSSQANGLATLSNGHQDNEDKHSVDKECESNHHNSNNNNNNHEDSADDEDDYAKPNKRRYVDSQTDLEPEISPKLIKSEARKLSKVEQQQQVGTSNCAESSANVTSDANNKASAFNDSPLATSAETVAAATHSEQQQQQHSGQQQQQSTQLLLSLRHQQQPPNSKRKQEICREFLRNACHRSQLECKFLHPIRQQNQNLNQQQHQQQHHLMLEYPTNEMLSGQLAVSMRNYAPTSGAKTTVCLDFMNGKCARSPLKCRYLHPVAHLQCQLSQVSPPSSQSSDLSPSYSSSSSFSSSCSSSRPQ